MVTSFLRNIDYAVFHLVNHTMANSFLDVICPVLRNAHTWIPLYIILGIYCITKYKKRAWIFIFYVILAFAISDSLTYHFIKPWFQRLRPCHNPLIQARLLLDNCGGKWGFPSSHASNHMAIALSIIMARLFSSKWINSTWILWAMAIGFAQIYVGVHYPLDIVGGFLTGSIIALFNYYIILPVLVRLHIKFSNS